MIKAGQGRLMTPHTVPDVARVPPCPAPFYPLTRPEKPRAEMGSCACGSRGREPGRGMVTSSSNYFFQRAEL